IREHARIVVIAVGGAPHRVVLVGAAAVHVEPLVAVAVEVTGHAALVDQPVAVVVLAVAHVGREHVHLGVAVIAVVAGRAIGFGAAASGLLVGGQEGVAVEILTAGRGDAVTVIVDPVAAGGRVAQRRVGERLVGLGRAALAEAVAAAIGRLGKRVVMRAVRVL